MWNEWKWRKWIISKMGDTYKFEKRIQIGHLHTNKIDMREFKSFIH